MEKWEASVYVCKVGRESRCQLLLAAQIVGLLQLENSWNGEYVEGGLKAAQSLYSRQIRGIAGVTLI